jgi:hypothetical protein
LLWGWVRADEFSVDRRRRTRTSSPGISLPLVLALVVVLVAAFAPLPGTVPPAAGADGDAGASAAPGTAGGEYVAITPVRIFDTRTGVGGVSGPRGGQQVDDVTVTGRDGVPDASAVTAVVINVTATNTTGPSFLTVWPSGEPMPVASNLNVTGNETVANLVTVKVGDNGKVSVFNYAWPLDVVFDIVGYYSSPTGTPGARFHARSPVRILDTRSGAPLGGGHTLALGVTGVAGVPAGASGVVMNVTVTQPTTSGFVTVFPSNVERPFTSNLNFAAGQTVPNLVMVGVPPNGVVDVYSSGGPVHVVVDVVGWYDADRSTESGRYVPLTPARVIDTRASGAIGANGVRNLTLTGNGGVPSIGAGVVVMNTTVTEPTAASYLTVYPQGTAPPNASNLNFLPAETTANLVVVHMSQAGQVSFYNREGSTHVVGDVAGYFTEVTFGFDTCEAPSTQAMATWKAASPYTAIGIYIGGGHRACANTALNNPNWVNTVVAQGWRLIPIYVGLQAPCTSFQFRIMPGDPRSQGSVAADDAVAHAVQAGLSAPAPIYFDMEGYNRNVAGCSNGVMQFIAGWVTRLHQLGWKAGLYSSLTSGIVDQVVAFQLGLPVVDSVWIAAWANPPDPSLYGFPGVPDYYWSPHQRLHQYTGGHSETWGGVTLNIDANVIDGPLAP